MEHDIDDVLGRDGKTRLRIDFETATRITALLDG